MKNYILIILMIVTIVLSGCNDENVTDKKNNNSQSEQEIVNNDSNEIDDNDTNLEKHDTSFYLFYSSSCGHCHSEREWIASIKEEYPYVDFKMYEVSENEELLKKVKDVYGIESNSVPLTIIGNDYFIGYSETKNRKFIRYFEALATFENCDVVGAIISNEDVNACMAKNEQ